MRDKRITALILTALCVICLCGCGDEIPDLTPTQQEMITEYSAALLLKYDSSTPSRLLPEGSVVSIAYVDPNDPNAVLTETTPETETGTDIPVDNVPDVTSEDVSVTDVTTGQTSGGGVAGFSNFLADLGVSFDYSGQYEVVDSYPEGGDVNPYFTVDASDGNKLLVIHFDLTNNSGSDMDVNLNNLNLRYRVSLNGGKNKFVMTTLLENDLLSYVGTLGSGQTEDIVAICEISEAEGADIQTIDFTVRGDGFSDVMSLK
ncbi:MAG: hypothetical protein J5509_04500 [Lachnospiraceae bacterium]|nr:hypothetical protein [Lachnospiraceae bacterium]